jgi:hypothetical protein
MKIPAGRHVLAAVGVVLVVLLAGLLFFIGPILWETHRLNQLCAALAPGTPLANVQPTIKRYGLWNSLVAYQFEHLERGGPGSFDERTNTWDIGVPAVSTMGDMECFITHNGSVVTATEIMGP